MNFPFRLPFTRPSHTEVRYVAATSAENKLARRKAIDRQLELAVAVCTLSDDEKAAAVARALSMPLTDKQKGRA